MSCSEYRPLFKDDIREAPLYFRSAAGLVVLPLVCPKRVNLGFGRCQKIVYLFIDFKFWLYNGS